MTEQGEEPEIKIINNQPTEGPVKHPRGYVDIVNNVWITLQGEGPFAGMPAVFIRTAGCNLSNQCKSCDSDYTMNRKRYSPSQIIDTVQALRKSGLVVITGGEPLRQDITALCKLLINTGYHIQLETNGSYWIKELDILSTHRSMSIVVSPKTPKLHPQFPKPDAYKYVIDAEHVDETDGLPSSVLGSGIRPARPRPGEEKVPVYISPCDSQNEEENEKNLRAAIQSVVNFNYRLSIQYHKLWGLP